MKTLAITVWDLHDEARRLALRLGELERSPRRQLGGALTPGRDEAIERVSRRLRQVGYTIGLHEEFDSHVAAAARYDEAQARHEREAERATAAGEFRRFGDLREAARHERRDRDLQVARAEHVRDLIDAEHGNLAG
jgi:hypothetical protein